ncbi:dihydropteroate synthase [Methanosarcina sp. 2.H.T.1A.6]|uniref:MBL fold metallo-hydrolase n=1 Tax=unclassified Methanosarcina TaxID=2644672 RepID=UPI0006216772|nr:MULTISPECIES: MBL fold metallo-hydrolase [unclassified Methanosarcina]KKG15200.1 dihydropteroate synthase [Methanosarcina sp. 2.H.T.1A.3]KKG17175.1 dihydropteroate synthase [Methanosarcina sp. 2.H.T.1A.15]KKG22885.1 dihydropteroate synthase [Methanosarcina sp. 2.H.T.1A.6]KKG24385.1 dihydropteroate synthase [Methanosarcina sp. 2.H.T.1A.8]
MNELNIREADRLEITVFMDNYTDMLLVESTGVYKRPQIPLPQILLAEHGLSCLIKVYAGAEEHTVLMDAAITPACLLNNIELLKADPGSIEVVVLSHGHPDHFLGLVGLLKLISEKRDKGATPGIPLILHPDAFLERRLNIPAIGRPVPIPVLNEDVMKEAGAVPVKSEKAFPIANGLIHTTGEIERKIPFEKGFPRAEAKVDGNWITDPFRDDQGLVIKLKGKGLVVISGCAHAGIINTVEHAKKITGTDKVHAVLGGFHLTGQLFDPIIQPTIDQMKRINPDYVVPMHCTGWKAINRFAEEMPGKFLLNTVGTTYLFGENF